ncbi:hypothetical protein [Weissella cibaria]|uniref:hypothetical protein n=1 Tax=Bacilli TaxID=91061 RepID=UPI00215B0826|nr:hypothetical protein [Weissella cibaria]MCR8704183.1 hypothetical protein [Weissella cibaria]
MALANTGLTENSVQKLMIDAGVIYKNLTFTTETGFTGDLLGATQGGVEINIEKKYRKIEVDGTKGRSVKGLEVVDEETATLKATLLEMTADNLALSAGGRVLETSQFSGYDQIEGKYTVDEDDYISNFGIVGNLSNGKKIIFIFDNVLITSALNIKLEDGKEGAVELEGTSHATFDQLNAGTSNWRILTPSGETTDVQEG